VRLRPALAADWRTTWPIWKQIVEDANTYALDPASSESDARRSWIDDSTAECWVVVPPCNEAVVGTYQLRPSLPGPGSHVANAAFMVASAARGRGVGRMMVDHCLRRARVLKYQAMLFSPVIASNEPAIRLYQSFGFTIVGTIPDPFAHPDSRLDDLLIMHRSL
jgi:ribosomal protein S18 acetylase RimI-like enzyme